MVSHLVIKLFAFIICVHSILLIRTLTIADLIKTTSSALEETLVQSTRLCKLYAVEFTPNRQGTEKWLLGRDQQTFLCTNLHLSILDSNTRVSQHDFDVDIMWKKLIAEHLQFCSTIDSIRPAMRV